MKLFDWHIAEAADRALASVKKEFIPMPLKPQFKGSVFGTMVLTLTAKDNLESTEAFDILRVVRESRRNRGFARDDNEILIAIKVQ